jgi:hypothetical protein
MIVLLGSLSKILNANACVLSFVAIVRALAFLLGKNLYYEMLGTLPSKHFPTVSVGSEPISNIVSRDPPSPTTAASPWRFGATIDLLPSHPSYPSPCLPPPDDSVRLSPRG